MRKITELAVSAFTKGEKFSMANTSVVIGDHGGHSVAQMYLHGNLIAERTTGRTTGERKHADVCVCDGGYRSNTTKERINGVLSHYGLPTVYQKKGVWYYSNGVPFGDNIDSEENYHSL